MKRVLITGATSGIGRALAELLANNDCMVTAVGRNVAALEELSMHSNISAVSIDLCDREQVVNHQSTEHTYDWVVLNAGTCEYIDDPVNFDSALFERVINGNLISMGNSIEAWTKCIAPNGTLALMGSSSGYVSLPRAEAYGSSKAAVAYLANTLRLRLEPKKIHVSLICPGFVRTPLTDLNDFAMPAIVSSEQAATEIAAGLRARKREIHFPKRLTMTLKLIGLLPKFMQLRLLGGLSQ